MSGRGFGSRRNVLIAIALAAGFALGLGLVVLGGGSDDGGVPVSADRGADQSGSEATPSTEPSAPLPLDDVTIGAVSELTGLSFPAGVEKFQTASLSNSRQLDITFTMAEADQAAFLSESGLAEPEPDERQIFHSSPLWKLNADGDSVISGVSDSTDRVNRSVELVPEGDGRVRARIVITSA